MWAVQGVEDGKVGGCVRAYGAAGHDPHGEGGHPGDGEEQDGAQEDAREAKGAWEGGHACGRLSVVGVYQGRYLLPGWFWR